MESNNDEGEDQEGDRGDREEWDEEMDLKRKGLYK